MSFLNPVRLVFSGTFQADVSTVNNDVRHYDNATFEPSYQEFQTKVSDNGWWNPTGSGAFRLIDCRVVGLGFEDGSFTNEPGADPAMGLLIGGSNSRTSGKLVDIDPQWQLASQPWGLDVRLTNGTVPAFFGGRFQPNAFRDLWFSRSIGQSNDMAASAYFQSILEGVSWDERAGDSKFLTQLRAATGDGLLSIRFSTCAYNGNVNDPRFTLGTVVGTIGPCTAEEPASFVRGRRFVPATIAPPYPGGPSNPVSWAGITYFTGLVNEAHRTAYLDLSNALQITDNAGTSNDIGPMTLGILRDPSIAEGALVTSDTFLPIAEVPYRDKGWLLKTAGIFAATLTGEQLALAKDHPLALVTVPLPVPAGNDAAGGFVAIREAADGVFVCAEPSVFRIDDEGKATSFVYATRYGRPMPEVPIAVTQTGPVPDLGGGGNGSTDPSAPIPVIGVPEAAVEVAGQASATLNTNTDGIATLDLATHDPGYPRGYIDGQIYLLDYRIPGQSDMARPPFDYIVLHVRSAFQVPIDPTWNDIAPTMTQYGNLYPIMSKFLVDLGDPKSVVRHADILHLAFSLDEGDPNYMPVTRDLSAPKRETILAWLDKVKAGKHEVEAAVAAGPVPRLRSGPTATAPRAPAVSSADAATVSNGKSSFAEGFARAVGKSRKP